MPHLEHTRYFYYQKVFVNYDFSSIHPKFGTIFFVGSSNSNKIHRNLWLSQDEISKRSTSMNTFVMHCIAEHEALLGIECFDTALQP